MRILGLLIVTLVLSVDSKPDPCQSGNCPSSGGCYCMDLTFYDYFGTEHGNCNTADPSGFRWCYVSAWSSCYHKQRSQRLDFLEDTPPKRILEKVKKLTGGGGQYSFF